MAAQERGNLEGVDDLGCPTSLSRLVDVGQESQSGLGFHVFEEQEAGLQPRASGRVELGAVGLIEGSLEDDRNAEFGRPVGQRSPDLEVQVVFFEDTGAGNESEVFEHVSFARNQTPTGSSTVAAFLPRAYLAAASMKEAKSGWGRVGRLLSSGWNWPATNHG